VTRVSISSFIIASSWFSFSFSSSLPDVGAGFLRPCQRRAQSAPMRRDEVGCL
jgi:hypothetical protein